MHFACVEKMRMNKNFITPLNRHNKARYERMSFSITWVILVVDQREGKFQILLLMMP